MSRILRLCLIAIVATTGVIGAASRASAAGFAGAPYISSGTNPNNGFFTLAWDPASGTPPVNYFVNRYDPRIGQVNDAVAFVGTDTTYTFSGAGEIEGVWQYYIGAMDAGSSTGGPLGVIVTVDKTGPTTPTASPDRAPDTADGWYADSVTITYAGSTDPNLATGEAGTGVAGYSAPQTFNTDGSHNYSGTATDNVGNVSGPASGTVKVDAAAPVVACDTPPLGWQSANVSLACAASDAGSGLQDSANASFTLTTSVAPGAADASASTDSRTVCDAVGHCATVGPFTGLQIDMVAPTVACDPAPTGWQATNVSIGCTGTDADSGLASAGDAAFALTTSVADGSEDANAATDSRGVCDVAGNCAPAGPLTGIMVDRAAPSIAITSPADGAVFAVGAQVTADYACADAGSGPVSCLGDVADGSALDTATPGVHTFTVSASDAVGNVRTRAIHYTVGGHASVASITFLRVPCAAAGGLCLQAWIQIQANGHGLPGAAVEVRFSTPTGDAMMVATSNRYGVATFTTSIGAAGQYAIAVTNVTAPGYDYTPADNAVTSRVVTLGARFR